jgi:hypothetical protein
MKIAKSHRELLKLLQEKEANGEHITKKEILRRTGWKDISFRTYWTKGQLSDLGVGQGQGTMLHGLSETGCARVKRGVNSPFTHASLKCKR